MSELDDYQLMQEVRAAMEMGDDDALLTMINERPLGGVLGNILGYAMANGLPIPPRTTDMLITRVRETGIADNKASSILSFARLLENNPRLGMEYVRKLETSFLRNSTFTNEQQSAVHELLHKAIEAEHLEAGVTAIRMLDHHGDYSGLDNEYSPYQGKRNLAINLAEASVPDYLSESNVEDFINEFSRRVTVPAMIALLGRPLTEHEEHTVTEETIIQFSVRQQNLLEEVIDSGDKEKYYTELFHAHSRLNRISRTWHQFNPIIPASLTPYKEQYEWYPILPDEPIESTNNAGDITYSWHDLTTTEELVAESEALGHCVGTTNYDYYCASGDCHIFSQRTPDGKILATVEATIGERDEEAITSIPLPDGEYLNVLQHEAFQGDRIKTGDKHEGLKNFLHKIETGEIALSSPRGRVIIDEDLKPLHGTPAYMRKCEYEPTWENVQAMFQEFKRPERRGVVSRNEDHTAHYYRGEPLNDWRQEERDAGASWRVASERKRHDQHHLIEGISNGRFHRDMHIKDWLVQSGFLESMMHRIDLPEKDEEKVDHFILDSRTAPGGFVEELCPPPKPRWVQREELEAAYKTNEREPESGSGQFVKSPDRTGAER